jgi:hypothetical protein
LIIRNVLSFGSAGSGLSDAKRIAPGSKLLRGRDPQLAAHGWYNTDHTVFPYGVHLAVVRVDRDTGKIAVERFMVAYDVGRAVNPLLIEGQLVGGCIQGLGGALSEEFVYDESGEPLSATFADYLMPTLHEVPDVEVLLTEDAPSPRHPLGLKGAGEGGTNAVGAAIAVIPNLPLIKVLLVTQVINGLLLPVVLFAILRLINDRELMGAHVNGRVYNIGAWLTAIIVTSLSLLLVLVTLFPNLFRS